MCPSSGRDIEGGADGLGAEATAVPGEQQCGDARRWSDVGADAFSLVLAHCVGSMTPVEDHYSPAGLPRAARFNLCLAVWYRVDGDSEWRPGMTANLSRSGVLFHASGGSGFSPQHPTAPRARIEVVIEVSRGALPSQIHCHATVARVVEPGPGEDLAAIAVTVGDYVLLAN